LQQSNRAGHVDWRADGNDHASADPLAALQSVESPVRSFVF
jgi:hypothetical protein